MKILVIGSAGMLGHMVCLYLRQNPKFTVMDLTKTNLWSDQTIQLNILDTDKIFHFINLHKFDAIINCAALLIQASEDNKSMAIQTNSTFPHLLEEWTYGLNTRIIQISSDGIFSGDKAPYKVNDIPNSRLFYARTKALGELDNNKDLTIRGSFFGPDLFAHGTGIFNWFFHQSGTVKGYQNIFFNGITNLECAKLIEYILLHPVSGCIHAGSCQSISKGTLLHQMARIWNYKKVIIDDVDSLYSDHTLAQIYDTQEYSAPEYAKMLQELKQWMDKHSKLYTHYKL